jgi:D-lactate dehydrogenase (cytochrome)
VRDVVDICRRHGVPMIPYGVGTSLEGHILAVHGRRVDRSCRA